MTVSLLIGCKGNIGHRAETLKEWLRDICFRQRLAGGSVLGVGEIELFTVDNEQNKNNLKLIVRKLLPGFILKDRSAYLNDYLAQCRQQNEDAELFDAWLEFINLKQKARPVSDLISRHLIQQPERYPENELYGQLVEAWRKHKESPYDQRLIPENIKEYFRSMIENSANKNLLTQWKDYCFPNEKTDADWEYISKPMPGFLVPVMVGYKAISQVYKNDEVANTRDDHTEVCFVEAVHSIGEWQGVHRIRDEESLKQSLWHYDYQKHWYLCRQFLAESASNDSDFDYDDPGDFS